jgi:thioesterase domain-containing protein
MIIQKGLVNYLLWAKDAYAAASGESIPVHSSIAFDLTVTALFVPLVAGGRIEMLREDVGGQNLTSAMRSGKNRTLVKITPGHLALLNEQLGPTGVAERTKLFVIGGENLTAESLGLWRDNAPDTRLINEYGPTETVVGCCVHEVAAGDPRTGSVPIGRPIANTQLYILDRHLNPLPPGIVGELYIGGAGVARGYMNRPELTKDRFLPDPFSAEIGSHIYKTGDLARYRPDGIIEYVGRVDNQVKVRGYRIELGEIESKLADVTGVKACAVLAREDTPGNKQLVAYVVRSDASTHADDLRTALAGGLPEYMVPGQFVFLDAMPLTTNGKVDRKALPAPTISTASERERARGAPRTPHERKLLAIWEDILGRKGIGINDNFFEIGGHSLQAIQVVTRMEAAFETSVSPAALFEAPTIAQLAELVTGEGYKPTFTSIVPIQPEGVRPPFFLVHAIGGNVFNYRLLSKHVGTEQPFYGLQARGISGDDPPHESLEAMAADYIHEIRQVQPSGPYKLGGASSGGVIAYEMARQLHALGERVALVVMLDTVRPDQPARIERALAGSKPRRLGMRLDFHIGSIMGRSPRAALTYVLDLVRWRRSGPAGQIAAAIKADNPKLAQVIEHNRLALQRYEPKAYHGNVVMLLSGDEPDRSFYDRRLAWADLIGAGLNVRFIPGDHENMLDEPNVQGVAEVLDQCLR